MNRRQKHCWRAVCAAVMAYEAVALASKGKVPMLTDVVRELPRPARALAAGIIAVGVWDHFDTQIVF